MSFSSLRVRILILVLLAVAPALALMVYTASEQQRVASANAHAEVRRLARFASGQHDQLVDSARQLLLALSQIPCIQEGDLEKCHALFGDMLRQQPAFANLGLFAVAAIELAAAWFGGHAFIGRRATALVDAACLLRDGEHGVRCPEGGTGEFSHLSRAFNDMAGALDRREDALRAGEDRYRTLIESSPDAHIVLAEGRVAYVNAAGVAMLGASFPEELLGLPYEEIVHAEHRENVAHRLRRLAEPRGRSPLGEERLLRRDGSAVDVEVLATQSQHEGRPAVLVVARDASARKGLEQQLRQSQKLEAVGQLAGGIAHDFNNVLTVILGYGQMLERNGTIPEPAREEIAEIRKAAERAASLTAKLLTFSRRQVAQPVLLDLNRVIGEMGGMWRRVIPETIRVVTTLPNSVAPVKMDPVHVEQVVMNLVVNARDAMEKGGVLTIETADAELDEVYAATHPSVQPGRYVMLAVIDTGCGMDESVRRRIFEPFFTTKAKDKGTGLGLATVFGIVRGCGGHIWVYSEVGRGTTFKIFLPAIAGQVEAPREGEGEGPSTRGTETVLLVEDEDAVRRLATETLRSHGYTVLEASDGLDALSVASAHDWPIDIVVTDVVMPKLGGPDLLRTVAQARPDLRALYMSGYTDNAMFYRGELGPGVGFLGKPFTLDSLCRKVRLVLDAPRV